MKRIALSLILLAVGSLHATTITPINLRFGATVDTVTRLQYAGLNLQSSVTRYNISGVEDTLTLADNNLDQVVYLIWAQGQSNPAGTAFYFNQKQAYSSMEQWGLYGLFWSDDVLGVDLETGYDNFSLGTHHRSAGAFRYDTTITAYSKHLNWAKLTLTFADSSQGTAYYYWNMKDTGAGGGTIVAPTPKSCVVYGFVTDVGGNFIDLATVSMTMPDGVRSSCDSTSIAKRTISARTDRTGRFQLPAVWSSCYNNVPYLFEIKKDGYMQPRSIKVIVPDSSTYKVTF